MKKVLLYVFLTPVFFSLFSTKMLHAQEKETIAIYVFADVKDDLQTDVLQQCIIETISKSGQYCVVNRTKDFIDFLEKEHDYQRLGHVNDTLLSKFNDQLPATTICGIIIKDYGAKDGFFVSCNISGIEKNNVIISTSYPAEGEKLIKNFDIKSSRRVAKAITERLGFPSDDTGISTKPPKPCNGNNTLAFFESAILPGLGQLEKGHVGHGIANMLGEAALLSGTVFFYNSAQKYKMNINQGGPVDVVSVNKYNGCVRFYRIMLGAAISLYVFNLFQTVIIKPNCSHFDNITMSQINIPLDNTPISCVGLTFNF